MYAHTKSNRSRAPTNLTFSPAEVSPTRARDTHCARNGGTRSQSLSTLGPLAARYRNGDAAAFAENAKSPRS